MFGRKKKEEKPEELPVTFVYVISREGKIILQFGIAADCFHHESRWIEWEDESGNPGAFHCGDDGILLTSPRPLEVKNGILTFSNRESAPLHKAE